MEVIEPSNGSGGFADRKEEFERALHAAVPSPRVTLGLIVINAAVFGLMSLRGVSFFSPTIKDLLRFGADYGPMTASGQWWRILTSTFVHIGIVHVLLNMWGLWQGGQLAERFYGHGAYLALYLASGIGGSLTSLAWSPTIVSAGASGAIFGVYGALLAVVVLHRREIPIAIFQDLRKSTVAVVGFNVFFGAVTPGIDNAAHLGGLATGFVVGVCLRCPMPELGSNGESSVEPATHAKLGLRTRLVRLAPVVVGLALAAFAAKRRVEAAPVVQADRHFDLAWEAWRKGDRDRAMEELDAALALEPDSARSWTLRGDLVWAGGDQGRAIECYRKAIALAPENGFPHLRLGWTEQNAGDLRAAEAEFTRAIELMPRDTYAYVARGWVRAQSGKQTEALDDYERALEADPSSDLARACRAHLLRDLRRYREALPVFQEYAAKDDQYAAVASLVAWTIRARLGEREEASSELRSRLEGRAGDVSSARIGAFLLGDLAQADLLAEVKERDQRSSNGQAIELCDAWYFIGMKALLDGDEEQALDAFHEAVSTRAIDSPLLAAAEAEINDEARLQRAHVLRDLGRASEALGVFQEFAAKTDDDRATLCALVAWTIRARAGEREEASDELRGRLTSSASPASMRIGAFLLGELTRERLVLEIEAIAPHDGKGPPVEVCNAWYFVGAKALADGDPDLARWAFKRAIGTRRTETPLHAAAAAELASLER